MKHNDITINSFVPSGNIIWAPQQNLTKGGVTGGDIPEAILVAPIQHFRHIVAAL